MNREKVEERYLRLMEDIRHLINNGQTSPELLMEKIEELQALRNSNSSENRLPQGEITSGSNQQGIAEFLKNVLFNNHRLSNESIDRQSHSVQIKQINGARTTIRDERIRHTDNGGLHSDVEQAIVISCEGKRIEAHKAEGICEVTEKLAQRALTCRLCHRSICIRHCEFIELDGANYPYCNTPPPKSRISCVKKTLLSIDTWRETERRAKNRRH